MFMVSVFFYSCSISSFPLLPATDTDWDDAAPFLRLAQTCICIAACMCLYTEPFSIIRERFPTGSNILNCANHTQLPRLQCGSCQCTTVEIWFSVPNKWNKLQEIIAQLAPTLLTYLVGIIMSVSVSYYSILIKSIASWPGLSNIATTCHLRCLFFLLGRNSQWFCQSIQNRHL